MPYRRLPNTDKSRIRAMQKALYAYENKKDGQKVYSADLFYKLNIKLSDFISVVEDYKKAYSIQIKNQKKHKQTYNFCKLYISHFVQVMNFAILRGEYSKKIRKYYNLPLNSSKVPSLQTEKELINIGKTIIQGEESRLKEGQRPITNPSLPEIKNSYEKFLDSIFLQKNLQNRTNIAQAKIVKLRPTVDKLIKNIWDEVEKFYKSYPSLIKREKAKSFGITYIYRKNEEKIELDDLLKI